MKKIILPTLLLFSHFVYAQRNTIYAFGAQDLPNQWRYIQNFSTDVSVSLRTIHKISQSSTLLDAYSRSSLSGQDQAALVAAAGYDVKNRQLFFVPMVSPELRWAKLESAVNPVIYSIKSNALSQLDFTKTEDQITRMTIDKNGLGYALTNDAMHLFEFTTDEKPQVKDLGRLVDASANGQQSVHSPCASFGGDLVAGDDGYLYLITMRNQIYSFHPQKRIAQLVGSIKGLPQSFTSNGAAANEDGELVLSCSNGDQNCYLVNPKTWEARPLFAEAQKGYNMSDLASGYHLSRSATNTNSVGTDLITAGDFQVYPNPLRGTRLQISLQNKLSGNYQVQLLDLSGKIINNRVVNLNSGTQSMQLDFPSQLAKGTYFLKLTDPAMKSMETTKLVIQ
jgi:hypothetical protein